MLPIEVTIESIVPDHTGSKLIDQCALESPKVSPVALDHQLLIAGWVLPVEGYTISSIEVVERDQVLKRAPVNVPRPDVLSTLNRPKGLSDCLGFHFELSLLGLAKRFELELRAALRNSAGEIEIFTLFRIKACKVSHLIFDTRYQPVQVTAIGRSGTTLLMQILGQHPEILTTDFYPYELRQAAYWMHFLKTSSAPANFLESAHPDKFEYDTRHIGHNPYNHPEYINQYKNPQRARDFYTTSTLHALAQLCVNRVDEYYKMVSEENAKPRARVFAEKFLPNQLQNVCSDLYKAPKEIILTRDFRDIISSARSFNTKRKNQAFGRDMVKDDFEWVDQLAAQGARRLCEAWQERSSQALHVKYEELIAQPVQQIKKIFEYLGVDCRSHLVDKIVDTIFSSSSDALFHSTASTPLRSVGRWKLDLSSELREHSICRLGYALSVFGYEL